MGCDYEEIVETLSEEQLIKECLRLHRILRHRKEQSDPDYETGYARGRSDRDYWKERAEKAEAALSALLRRDERNTCQHEETHRGGAIWEICDRCDAKWADDMGGKPTWVDPPEWVNARAALKSKEEANG